MYDIGETIGSMIYLLYPILYLPSFVSNKQDGKQHAPRQAADRPHDSAHFRIHHTKHSNSKKNRYEGILVRHYPHDTLMNAWWHCADISPKQGAHESKTNDHNQDVHYSFNAFTYIHFQVSLHNHVFPIV